MIISLTNAKVKWVRSLARRRARSAARQFAVEGVRLIEEAVGAGASPALVLYGEDVEHAPRSAALLERLRALTSEVFPATETVMRTVTNTETPQGIVAIFSFIELPFPPQPRFLLLLDAVRDPGNVGTILRSARAAGVDSVVFAPGTADPYNDKVVRAAMGAHFYVPIRFAGRWDQVEPMLSGVARVYLADARGEIDYAQAEWTRPIALIVGGEADGATPAARALATARVKIPMHGGSESLNAAMAATVLLFHAARGSAERP